MIRSAAAVALAVVALASCGTPLPQDRVLKPPPFFDVMLREQSRRYALMQPEDLYKLIHQAFLGPSTLFMGSNSKLDSGLNVEIQQIADAPAEEPGEPEIELLDPQLALARVNLRPYLQHGGKAENLLRAIARTAREHRGDRGEFLGALERAEEMIPELNLGIFELPDEKADKKKGDTQDENDAESELAEEADGERSRGARNEFQKRFHEYVEKMKEHGYPAGDHSAVYANVYAPAYRLVYLQYVTDRDYGGRRAPDIDEYNGLNPDPWARDVRRSASQPASAPATDGDFAPADAPPHDEGGESDAGGG